MAYGAILGQTTDLSNYVTQAQASKYVTLDRVQYPFSIFSSLTPEKILNGKWTFSSSMDTSTPYSIFFNIASSSLTNNSFLLDVNCFFGLLKNPNSTDRADAMYNYLITMNCLSDGMPSTETLCIANSTSNNPTTQVLKIELSKTISDNNSYHMQLYVPTEYLISAYQELYYNITIYSLH